MLLRLVSIDELHNWGEAISELEGSERKIVFEQAVPLWVERMVREGKLLLNPSVIKNLKLQNWIPNELQKKMIWASIICKLDSPHHKEEKARIRELIKNKYNEEWWEDIYKRAGKVWPAWDRYKNNILGIGPATKLLASHSSFLNKGINDELKNILSMVPAT